MDQDAGASIGARQLEAGHPRFDFEIRPEAAGDVLRTARGLHRIAFGEDAGWRALIGPFGVLAWARRFGGGAEEGNVLAVDPDRAGRLHAVVKDLIGADGANLPVRASPLRRRPADQYFPTRAADRHGHSPP